ncbi:DegT/DnrJ/EryC1/StrS family aminotransferase [Haloplanus aerogenes]|uniref:DegT/DnrJ/EryC1/StrS family aminotransferase n=1 Tax=Haloplanus aerogenes TaxID=660522 RepID=A0A3M0DNR3_9EURY|nr:DegT/DnrJ/EryC1/StrS family aminotransferase [Haloplanus aerogenes]AZH24765.1 DegT/DnrJ/EryC1/StrS family aminotransferase [Haloplanus aerogenes]RMB23571.1 dTDP-4-amino-4,6-dideoxygalactose transaminase [Haloplanus aerogenes]
MVDEVPFVDITIDDEMISEAVNVLESGRLVKGPECEALENAFADLCSTDHAIGVSNGTAALLLSMKALDINPRDQVFVPGHTYFATVSPVLELGADPVFVDVDPDRYTMDPELLKDAIDEATNPEAIVVTHMHGQPAEMDAILEIADEYGLTVIEDAAQAHRAIYDGQPVGSFGDVGCFSFYPTKNMTVGGDGGMITTDDPELAAEARALRNHGRDESGKHTHLGLNYRLDEVKAAIGREQLTRLPDWIQARREAASQYNERLQDIKEVILPETYPQSKHVYHHYPVLVPASERAGFRTHLDEHRIGTGIHYEEAVHQHKAVRDRVKNTTLPVAEDICARTVSLPMHPQLSEPEVKYVCNRVGGYFQ